MNIPETFRKQTFDYTLIQSEQLNETTGKAMYEQRLGGNLISHEVMIIKYRLNRFTEEMYWSLPGNSSWGSSGWTIKNLDKAIEKYNSIIIKD